MTDAIETKEEEKKEKKNYYGEVAYEWWKELIGVDQERQDGAGRATLARLRRCNTPSEAFSIASVNRLLLRLNEPDRKNDEYWLNRVAILAITLGYVKQHKHLHGGLMDPVGRETLDDAESAKFSEGRFRRFLQVREPEEMLTAFRRLVKFMPDDVDIKQLARTILHWNDNVRCDLAFSYYGAYRGLAGTTTDR